MKPEGVIKYRLTWTKTPPLPRPFLTKAIMWRDTLNRAGLIGVYPDGIGFGNLSVRIGDTFVITGSGTGGLKNIGPEHFTIVTDHDFANNSLSCSGPVKASSESLTHAAIYETIPNANAVVHIHNKTLWERYNGKLPTTDKKVPYGDPKMKDEIARLYHHSELRFVNLLVMGGHEEGLIAYHRNLDDACEVIMQYHKANAL